MSRSAKAKDPLGGLCSHTASHLAQLKALGTKCAACTQRQYLVPRCYYRAEVMQEKFEYCLTRCASTASCTTCQAWQRTDAIAAAARRAVQLLALEALASGHGSVAQEGIEAAVTGYTAPLRSTAVCAVVCHACVVSWCWGVGRLAACTECERAQLHFLHHCI